MLHTAVCDTLGIQVPIISAPMRPNISTPELAAAISNAGGLGMISFGANPPALLRKNINRIRELTDQPFGVNFLAGVPFPVEEQFKVCIEERVPVLSFFWGDPSPYVARAKEAGIKVMDQVGSVEAAERSLRAGVDVVIAQGTEAGGHVAGKITTMVLVPRIVDAITPVPVVAAGGIGDARGLAAALALGAEGVVIGTRLLATPEANAHPIYKQKIVEATEEETVLTTLFGGGWPNAPHRTLRTAFVEQWLSEEERGSAQRTDEPIIGETYFMGQRMPVQQFASLPPEQETVGEITSMALLAGQSVGFANAIKPVERIIKEMIDGATEIILRRMRSLVVQ